MRRGTFGRRGFLSAFLDPRITVCSAQPLNTCCDLIVGQTITFIEVSFAELNGGDEVRLLAFGVIE
jgi:hypothetical protein